MIFYRLSKAKIPSCGEG